MGERDNSSQAIEQLSRQIAALTSHVASVTKLVHLQDRAPALPAPRLTAKADPLRETVEALTAVVVGFADRMGPKAVPTVTLEQLFTEFDQSRSNSVSWKVNRNRLLPLIRRLGHLPAVQLTPMVWAEHALVRSGEYTRLDKPPKPYLVQVVELGRAKELLSFGVSMGYLDKSPLVDASPPERAVSQRETWLDDAGIEQLFGGIAHLPHRRAKLIMAGFMLLCLDGMMRHNEARRIRRDHVRDGVVVLAARSTKSKKQRTIALTPRTLAALEAIPPVVGVPWIFANPQTGKPYGKSMMQNWFRTVCVESKIDNLAADGERVVIHTLRHSGASGADALGASPIAIRDCLGHSSLKTTERYLHRHRTEGARDLARLMSRGASR